MGNNQPEIQGHLQGEFVPIPLDDFDEAPPGTPSNQHSWVCRAALGSELVSMAEQEGCAGDVSHLSDFDAYTTRNNLFIEHAGDMSCHDELIPQTNSGAPLEAHTLHHQSRAHEQPVTDVSYISIKGGANPGTPAELNPPGLPMMAHDYASTTDCILQNLTMTIGNPSAHCFANAPWRAFTWTCALLQETSTQPWGSLQEAVQESLDTAEHVDLHQLPGMQSLWKQHDLNLQGDANHFVNSLWLHSQTRAFHYRYAEIRENGYLVDHVQMPILIPYPDDGPEDLKFQDLINGWANQGMGQYLMDDKKVLICHVTRNTMIDGIATKHCKTLNPYGTFTVPRSLDGFARTSTEFVPAVLICHRGKTHDTGHYFAILIYRDLMWLADDGKVPTYLPFLTPKLASQITQIWAVDMDIFRTPQQIWRSLPPPEEPDYEPPLHPSPPKRARLAQSHNKLHYANVTNFGRQVIDWYWTREGEVHIFAETHLDPQRHGEICQYFTIRGRTAFGTPAATNCDNNGTHGGLLVLADPSSCLTELEAFTLQGCGYQSFLWQATDSTILVIGLYLRNSETLQSDTNAAIIGRILALITATKHPYVIIGDWQNPPDAIASTVLPAKFHFGILAPDHSVLSGNVLDYGLLHDSLASTTALTTEWAVPWRPHALLTLHVDIEAAARECRQIQHFPTLPKVPDIDFRPWTTYHSQAYQLCLYDIPPNDSAQQWADWLSRTEQYLLQEHPWAAQGRGANLQAITKPLVATQPTQTWRKGKPAFWEQLAARFQLAVRQKHDSQHGPVKGFMQAINDAAKHWHGPPTWGQFLDTAYHWHKYRDPHAADLLTNTMQHQLKETQQHANDNNMLQYQEWLRTGQQKGLQGLFRGLKSSELAWERPYRKVPIPDRMTHRLQDWGALWGIRDDNTPHPRNQLAARSTSASSDP